MPVVTFFPLNVAVTVEDATSLASSARIAGISMELPCGGQGSCGRCVVRILSGRVMHTADGKLSKERLAKGYVLACRSFVSGCDVTVEIPDNLEKTDGRFTDSMDGLNLIPAEFCPSSADMSPLYPDTDSPVLKNSEPVYGIAVDIGTTTVAVSLVSLPNGLIENINTDYNSQIKCGLDVISRINFSLRPGGLDELSSRILDTINTLISRCTDKAGIKNDDIVSAAISGNTTMIHLLRRINPDCIRREPFLPAFLCVPMQKACDTGLLINKNASVIMSPAVGSYVGGDITAGVLCTSFASDKDSLCLFMDIGTNGELVFGNSEFLLTCACSAGPAFEGGGIGCGMRASTGAIERVTIDPDTGEAQLSIIGNSAPSGICGSGIISLVANLFRTGWLDPSGNFNRGRTCKSIRIEGRRASYMLAPANKSAKGKDLIITETDIDNILRAKAAVYAACSLMMKQAGVQFGDLETIYIAGGFGRFMDIENSIAIGLLPDCAREKFRFIGNASLAGTWMTLVSEKHRRLQKEIAERMTYLELTTDSSYMDEYTAALFIPHTDRSRFPSVVSS
jgi:uncharacterized 2Fe-2S/4Fe-4S cluster protein (DUF4445 family)